MNDTGEPDPMTRLTGSEPYTADNLLDRLSGRSALQFHYDHVLARERAIVRSRVPLTHGDVLSVGCGWNPGRHLFPAPAFRLVAVDADAGRVQGVIDTGSADRAIVGHAGHLDFPPATFDVVLYRLVLHHIAFHGPLDPCFEEAARLLRPGGALVTIEPGAWHPVGAALTVANRAGLGIALHGTEDDIPLSPRALAAAARRAGLDPELHAVTYGWRRLPPVLQRGLRPLDALGSRRRAAWLGHTVMVIARTPADARHVLP